MLDIHIPLVSRELISYLKSSYTTEALIARDLQNAKKYLGFIIGVRDVTYHLEFLLKQQEQKGE